MLIRYRIPSSDAEDLLQTTLLTYCYKRKEIRNPAGWVYATFRNRCRMYWRGRRRRTMEPISGTVRQLPDRSQLEELEQRELRRDLSRVLRQLPERHARLLWLRFVLGLSGPEIAKATGYAYSGMQKLIRRSLDRAGTLLEGQELSGSGEGATAAEEPSRRPAWEERAAWLAIKAEGEMDGRRG